MSKKSDEEKKKKVFQRLMASIRRDPQKGLRLFYDTYGRIIQATAQAICRSSDKAGEVIDDVFVKVWEYAEEGGGADDPDAWVHTVTANAAKQAMRGRRELPLREEIAAADDRIGEVLDRHSFYWMIEDLSEIEQAVMVRRFVSLATFQEIAEEFGKPLTTVASVYYRAFGKIKKKLEEKSEKF